MQANNYLYVAESGKKKATRVVTIKKGFINDLDACELSMP